MSKPGWDGRKLMEKLSCTCKKMFISTTKNKRSYDTMSGKLTEWRIKIFSIKKNNKTT